MKRTLIRLFLASILVVGYVAEKIYASAHWNTATNSFFLNTYVDVVSNEGNRLLRIAEWSATAADDETITYRETIIQDPFGHEIALPGPAVVGILIVNGYAVVAIVLLTLLVGDFRRWRRHAKLRAGTN